MTTFAQLSARLKNFLRGWLLVLGLKEGLVTLKLFLNAKSSLLQTLNQSNPVRNSLWKKKNRASDIEGKFHAILKCRIWIYHQKLFSSLDIRDSMHFGIYLEKWAIFWLFLRSSVLATSGYTTHFPCVLGCNQMWPVLKISKIAKK